MLVLLLLARVVKKIKDDLDGFDVKLAEATPPYDGSETRNSDRPKSHVRIPHIGDKR